VTVLHEGFEGSFPGSWTLFDGFATSVYWDDVSSSFGGEGAHGGVRKAYCAGIGHGGTTSSPTYPSYFASSMARTVDLSGFRTAKLSFWYKQPSILSCTNGPYVFVHRREPPSNLISWHSTAVRTSWTKVELDISAHAGRDGVEVLFLFMNNTCYGSAEGWYIDDVVLAAER
jgi:hypothetical protein